MNDEVKILIEKTERIFPTSFINDRNEFIIEPKNNIYFRLEDVHCELDFKCKVIAWMSRPSCKGVNDYWQRKIRRGLNELLETNFTQQEMTIIYTVLGNDVSRSLCEAFIQSNFDLSLLSTN